jgi:hypothetical protein
VCFLSMYDSISPSMKVIVAREGKGFDSKDYC